MTKDEAAKDLANCYARVFLGESSEKDGKRVLADLRAKFGLKRKSFPRGNGHRHDPIEGAIIDGERGVMIEIENAITIGAPDQALTGFLP